jgi:hypothetical protein
MQTVEKYRDLARALRERAALPAQERQRDQMLAVALHFERLALEIERAQNAEPLAFPLGRTRSSGRPQQRSV